MIEPNPSEEDELHQFVEMMASNQASQSDINEAITLYKKEKDSQKEPDEVPALDADGEVYTPPSVEGDPKKEGDPERPSWVPDGWVWSPDDGAWVKPEDPVKTVVKEQPSGRVEEPVVSTSDPELNYTTVKSRYQEEGQSEGEFFHSIKPGFRIKTVQPKQRWSFTEEKYVDDVDINQTHVDATTVQTYGGITYNEDPVKFEELKFIWESHERATTIRDRSAGEYSDLDDAELVRLQEDAQRKTQDALSTYTPDPELQYNYEDHANYLNQELTAGYTSAEATAMSAWKVAKDKDQEKLVGRLSAGYQATVETDYADELAALRAESTSEANRISQEFITQFDLDHPNGASQEEVDAANMELQNLIDARANELQAPVNELITSDITSKIEGSDEYKKFQNDYYKAAVQKRQSVEDDYIAKWEPTYDRFTEDELNNIGRGLDMSGFVDLSGPDKKIMLEATLNQILERAEAEGGVLTDEDTLEIKNEFFSHFYEKLKTAEDGSMSQFQAKDIADQVLDFTGPERERLIAEEVARLKASGFIPKRIKGATISIENQAKINISGSEQGKALKQARRFAEDVIANPETIDDMGYSEFWAGVTSRRGYQYLPFIGGIVQMNDSGRIQRIADKRQEDRTDAERHLLAMSSVKQQSDGIVGELSPWYGGGQIAGDMIPFVGEFVATGPLFRGAKTTAQIALKSRLAARLSNTARISKDGGKLLFTKLTPGVKLADKSINALSTAFGLGAQNTGQWMRVGNHMYENMTDEHFFAFTTDADPLMERLSLDAISASDDVGKEIGLQEGAGFTEGLATGFMQNYFELFTERLGMHLPGLGKRGLNLMKTGKGPLGDVVANADLFKRISLGHGLRKLGLDNVDDFHRWSQTNGGWNGFLGETTEELINMPLQNMLTGASLLEGIFEYDQLGRRQGLDYDGLKPLLIGLAGTSLAFGGGGAVLSKVRGNKDPAYYVNNNRFTEWKAAKAYLNTMKSKGLMNSSLDIEIRNDYVAYDEAATILEKNGLKADQIKTPALGVKGDKITATEIEVYDRLDSAEDRKTLEDNSNKIAELEERKQEVKDSKKKKKQKGKEIAEIQTEINGLKKANSSIVDPIKQSIIEEKTKVQYQETLEKVREINQKYGKGKLIIGEPTKTAGEARSKARDILLAELGIEEVRTTKTNKSGSKTTTVAYREVKTGETINLSSDQLLEIDSKLDEFQTAHGYIVPGMDGNPSQLIINEEAAIAGRGENVAAHEYLHFFLQQTFKDNPEIAMATGRAFQRHLANIDPRSIRDGEFRDRLTGYLDKGELVTAEESMTLFLDALSNGSMDYNESTMNKLGDIVRRLAQSLGFKVEFKEGRDVHNFLKDFNNSMQRGDLSKGLVASMEEGIKVKGEIAEQSKQIKENAQEDIDKFNEELKAIGVKKSITLEDLASVPGATYRFSKPKSAKQAEVDGFGRNPDGSKMTNEQWDMEGSIIAYQELIENGKLIPLVTKGMQFPVYGRSKESFVEDVMFGPSGGVAGTLFRFKPEQETEETGKFGLSGWLNPQINLRKLDVIKEYEKDQGTMSLDVTMSSETGQTFADQLEADPDAAIQAFEEQDLSIRGKQETAADSGPKKFKETVKLDNNKINETVKEAGVKLTGLVYKDVKKLVVGSDAPLSGILDEVSSKFGIPSTKIVKKSDLNTSQREAAQQYVRENTQALIDMLPEGESRSGTATGVANTKLGEFYVKGKRGSYAEGATASGKPTQTKRSDISIQEFQELFGINQDGTTINNRKYDGALRELAVQAAVITANQELREEAEASGSAAERVMALMADGRSQVMFSQTKAAVPERLKEAYNNKYNDLVKAVSQSNPGSIKAVTRAVESVFTKADGFSKSNIKNLSQIIFARVRQYAKIVDSHRLTENEVIDFGKTLEEFLLEAQELETLDLGIQKALSSYLKENGKELPKDSNGKEIPLGNLFLDLDRIMRHRAMVPAIAESLINNGYSSLETAEIMIGYMKGMFAGLTKIGDGRYTVDAGFNIVEDLEWDVRKDGSPGNKWQRKNGILKLDKNGDLIPKKNRKQTFDSTPDFINTLKSIPGLENITKVNPKTGKPSQGYYLNGKKIEATLLADNVDAFMKDKDFEGRTNQSNKAREYSEVILDVYYKELNGRGSNLDWADFGMILTTMGSGMESVLRKAAPAEYIMEGMEQVIAEGKAKGLSVGKIARYEHARPQAEIALKILHSYLDSGGLNPNVWDGYKVAIISAEMDGVMGGLGLTSRSPLDGKPRYFHENTFGDSRIKPLRSIDPKKKGTTAEFVGKDFVAAGEAIQSNAATAKNLAVLGRAYRGIKLSKGKPKGITVLDFDDTLATTKSNVLYTTPDGKTGKLNAEEFAKQGGDLLAQGVEFDFSEFNKVVGGKTAPLFNKAMKLSGKFGTDNMFILTARAPESARAIKQFLDAQGLNIPLKNITGLGKSEASAKANWIAEKVGEGYNDFYFADDAMQNVKAVKDMLDLFDVKGKVQQARIKFSKSGPKKMADILGESALDIDIILEQTKGVGREKGFSTAKAKQRGKGKGKFKFFLPPSAEDFAGLVYSFLGKGKQGEKHHAWFKENLFDPYSKGIRQINTAKQLVAKDMRSLRRALPKVKKVLKNTVPGTEYTHEQAIRVYNWARAGVDIPGLSKTDQKKLVSIVENDSQLKAFADGVNSIAATPGGLQAPTDSWLAGTIPSDMNDAMDASRERYLEPWLHNKNVIFSEQALNKIEAVYGSNFREALEDVLYRMEYNSNRTSGQGRLLGGFMDWINGSIGATMFFNSRSAILQTMSSVNFINWSDNNPLKAAAAFANQKQYWADVAMIFNSPFLKQRRSGLAQDVNTAELAEAVKGATNPARAAIGYLLQLGFTPTQVADSFAIASGGATMYRNRIKSLMEGGMTQKEAEAQAFTDFMEIAEETQQSARPDRISQQQASPLGKVILAFQNTPMQYNRLMKKAMLDLVNGRGDAKTHMSKILYYGAIQNAIFYSLQTALYAMLFGDDDEDEEERQEAMDKKTSRIVNGMIDGLLRGAGIGGAVVSTLKNVVLEHLDQKKKLDDDKFYTDYQEGEVIIELLNLSPPIGIKARKISSGLKTWLYNRDVIDHMSKTDIDNPIYDSAFSITEGLTNVPLSRAHGKLMNLREAANSDHETWKRVSMFLGWNKWSFGIQNQDVLTAKGEVKAIKAVKAEEKREKKKEEKAIEKAEENKAIEEGFLEDQKAEIENKKKDDKIKCAAVTSSGKRCGKNILKGQSYCTIHESVEQNESGKKSQCKHTKKDGKRCKVKTANKSGLCYYHD